MDKKLVYKEKGIFMGVKARKDALWGLRKRARKEAVFLGRRVKEKAGIEREKTGKWYLKEKCSDFTKCKGIL